MDSHDQIDVSVAHPARRYNYWLGGKDNFAADRESGDLIARAFPETLTAVRANRDFLGRAVDHLAASGIRQFLDIGTGLPTENNTHEVAQAVAPESRIVYVDNDPLVLVHARALLRSHPAGRTAYLQADLTDPAGLLGRPELTGTLDLTRPVAVMLVAVLHFVPGEGAARPLVDQLLAAMPSGSALVVTHATLDFFPEEKKETSRRMQAEGKHDVWSRGRDEFAALFDGLDLLEPGIVPVNHWRADAAPDDRVALWSAIGRKP